MSTSPTFCLILAFSKSEESLDFKYRILSFSICALCCLIANSCSSCSLAPWGGASGTLISSLIEKKEPLPKVASSISATDDSTACCKAGEIICDLSFLGPLPLSVSSQMPLHFRSYFSNFSLYSWR